MTYWQFRYAVREFCEKLIYTKAFRQAHFVTIIYGDWFWMGTYRLCKTSFTSAETEDESQRYRNIPPLTPVTEEYRITRLNKLIRKIKRQP